ncbi:MAG: ABC transporter ATP-binding protein [Spirochaetales bacterium]|jgi:ATP-binding cassette, subfamily B, bacterial|nr:ABC transporter ATP-binding protein [Spirochaetales bacterium]
MKRSTAYWSLFRFRPGNFSLMVLLRLLIFSGSFHVVALITRTFFDNLTGETDLVFSPYVLCAFLIANAFVRAGAIFLDIPIHFRTVFALGALLRRNAFVHVLDQPGANALPSSSGEAISRFRGDADVLVTFMTQLPFLVANLTSALIALIVMLSIDPVITALVLVPVLAIITTVQMLRNRVQMFRKASREAAGSVTGFIGEMFSFVEAVKVAIAEKRMIRKFRVLNHTRQKAAVRDQVFSTGLQAIFHNVVNIGTGIILFTVARAMKSGDFSVGDFALFIYYIGILTGTVTSASEILIQHKQTKVSLDRLGKLYSTGSDDLVNDKDLVKHTPVHLHGSLPDVPTIEKRPEHRLEALGCRNISYRFPGSKNGIMDISLTIPCQTLTVITGRVGSGKTTLLRILLGLLRADSGELLWNGNTIEDPVAFLGPPRTAYTPQKPRLFSDTLKNNILLGLPDTGTILADILNLAVMEGDISELEHGVDTTVGPKGVKLSGGQKHRAAAARMLMRAPELLVFDDLSSALDVHTEQLMWSRLLKSADATFLAVSHRPFMLRQADQIIVLKDGKIDGAGEFDRLIASNQELQNLWDGILEK